jgi:hypothetical protein
MRTRRGATLVLAAGLGLALAPTTAAASPPSGAEEPRLLAKGLQDGSGSTIGPDGALYVTEGVAGRVSRIDRDTGDVTTFADCLPVRVAPIGGAVDVAFLDDTAYVLVSMVGPDLGGDDVSGIYRVDGPHSCTAIADIGAFSIANPPDADIFVLSGVQYALEIYKGGFLVTDGHHNRVLGVDLDGEVREVLTLPNVVPTGLDVARRTVYLALAGPVPHEPEDGVVVAFRGTDSPTPRPVASGARLLVDVEVVRGHHLLGLAQGVFPVGAEPGAPALPDTGQLLRAQHDGSFAVVTEGLDRPTSLEIVGRTAYVVTLDGEVWAIEDVTGGHGH